MNPPVFSVEMRTSEEAAAAITDIPEQAWQPAREADGTPRPGAQVAEWPALVPAWAPGGTRAIVRRERLGGWLEGRSGAHVKHRSTA